MTEFTKAFLKDLKLAVKRPFKGLIRALRALHDKTRQDKSLGFMNRRTIEKCPTEAKNMDLTGPAYWGVESPIWGVEGGKD